LDRIGFTSTERGPRFVTPPRRPDCNELVLPVPLRSHQSSEVAQRHVRPGTTAIEDSAALENR
jgi:hypothetical protein